MTDFRDEAKGVGAIIGGGILLAIVLILIGYVGYVVDTSLHQATTKIRVNREINDQVNNGNHVLSASNAYFSAYNGVVADVQLVKATEAQITAFKNDNPRDKDGKWDYATSQNYGQLTSLLLGEKNNIQQKIKDFNERSDEWQESQFKDPKLPNKLDPENPPTEPLRAESSNSPTLAPVNSVN